jgi:hypothetical protein
VVHLLPNTLTLFMQIAASQELPPQMRHAALQKAVQECEDAIQQAYLAMQTAVSRANSEWADRRDWGPPAVDETPAMPGWQEHPSK